MQLVTRAQTGFALAPISVLLVIAACGAGTSQRFTQEADSMGPTIVRRDVIEITTEPPVRRGDVVVFRLPKGVNGGGNTNDIKRVVALPGETISFVDGRVEVDGVTLEEPYLRPGEATYAPVGKLLHLVPAGRYFVLGDNRGQSRDSRSFGPIDKSSIVGVATKIVSPPAHARTLKD